MPLSFLFSTPCIFHIFETPNISFTKMTYETVTFKFLGCPLIMDDSPQYILVIFHFDHINQCIPIHIPIVRRWMVKLNKHSVWINFMHIMQLVTISFWLIVIGVDFHYLIIKTEPQNKLIQIFWCSH